VTIANASGLLVSGRSCWSELRVREVCESLLVAFRFTLSDAGSGYYEWLHRPDGNQPHYFHASRRAAPHICGSGIHGTTMRPATTFARA